MSLFGSSAAELTEGQWTYILIMRMLEADELPGNKNTKIEAAYDLVEVEVDDE